MDKRFNHDQAQQDLQKLWQEKKVYDPCNKKGDPYTIDTPPPTISGKLHIGHIFSYTQTDIIARYKRMSGFTVFYPFGFDDNGLPTERYVEKKYKIRPHEVGRVAFNQECLKATKEVSQEFKSLWQQMGLSAYWDQVYSTISDSVLKISQESFLRLLKKDFVYRDNEPALYCVTCRTTVAQAELDDSELPSVFYDINFADEQGNALSISTTRPELLGSCVALFYAPGDKRYMHLEGKKAEIPLFGKSVPILSDDQVNPEKGTGLVMCCTFGDKTDIYWFKKYNLSYVPSINRAGKMTEKAGQLEGLTIKKARDKIVELLQEKQFVTNSKSIVHTVNLHERCKKEIEYTMLNQWFLNVIDHKQLFLDAAEKINWRPAFMKHRYIDWVKNISWNWCLSRQRFYGIPFPVWHCNDCAALLTPLVKDLPVDPQQQSFFDKCTNCSSRNISPDTDVMDTWNSSSLSPYICFDLWNKIQGEPVESVFEAQEAKSFLPMSMRPQAHDIIRTWAFYTVVKATLHSEVLPWKDCVISGHVVSKDKEKLSKSKNNSILDPAQLLKKYPADAIRYWTASGRLGTDIAFSESQLKIGIKLVTKIWNAFRFIKEHVQDLTEKDLNFEHNSVENIENQWVLSEVSHCFDRYQQQLNMYEFSFALDTIEEFFWKKFCDTHLELIKHRFFNPEQYSAQELEETKKTLYVVGLSILQMYASYIPYVTDAIFQELYQPTENVNSLHATKYLLAEKTYSFVESQDSMKSIIAVVGSIRKLKTDHQLSLKVPVAELVIYAKDEIIVNLKKGQLLITGSMQVEKVIFKSCLSVADSILEQKNDQWYAHIYL